MKGSPIRIGVAGLGFGARVHIPILQSLPGVRVVAVAGRDSKRAEKVALKFHIEKGCGDLEEFFREHLDAVTLALPPRANARAARMALLRGIPVLAEKPLALSGREASRLARLSRGIPTMINFQFSELDAFKQLKKIVQTRRFGSVRHVNVTWFVESYLHRHRRWSWKLDAHECGGVVSMLGAHVLYLAQWLFGPVKYLFAETGSDVNASLAPSGVQAAPDHCVLHLQLSNGIVLFANLNNASPPGICHRWEIVFDRATVVLYNPVPNALQGFDVSIYSHRGKKTLSFHKFQKDDPFLFRIMAEKFIHAVRNKNQVTPSFEDGAHIQILMDAVALSSRKRKAIDIPSFITRYVK